MNMKEIRLALVLGFILFLSFSALAFAGTQVFVKPAQGSLDPASLETVTELVKSAVPQNSGFELTENQTQSEFLLSPKVLALGEALILKIEKIKKGQIVHVAQLKASSLSDMDTIAVRVVRAALNDMNTERNAEVTDVTHEESVRGVRRYQATRQWFLGFGPAKSGGIGVSKENVEWNLGYVWDLDPDWDVWINYLIYRPSGNASFDDLSLGVHYYFTRAKTSLFLTTGLGRGTAAVEGDVNSWLNLFNSTTADTASGWCLNIGLGYKFFRTSTVNLATIFQHTYILEKTKISNHNPNVTSLLLGIYF